MSTRRARRSFPRGSRFRATRLMEEHFGRLVNYDFTAELESVLDKVSRGDEQRIDVLQSFWSGEGEGDTGLKNLVEDLGDIDARELSTFPLGDGVNVRVGRYGPYVEGPPMVKNDKGEEVPTRSNVPEDMPPDELTLEMAKELLLQAGRRGARARHPPRRPAWRSPRATAASVRTSPRRCPRAPKKADKPRTASLFKDMDLDTVTLGRRGEAADACRALSARATTASRSPRRTVATART